MMAVEEHHGKPVECPNCKHQFYYQRSKKGAGYARDWLLLPDCDTKFLCHWLGSPFATKRCTKDQLIDICKTTSSACQGRISELYSLDLVNRHEAEPPAYPLVTYSLNISRVTEILNNNGKLRDVAK